MRSFDYLAMGVLSLHLMTSGLVALTMLVSGGAVLVWVFLWEVLALISPAVSGPGGSLVLTSLSFVLVAGLLAGLSLLDGVAIDSIYRYQRAAVVMATAVVESLANAALFFWTAPGTAWSWGPGPVAGAVNYLAPLFSYDFPLDIDGLPHVAFAACLASSVVFLVGLRHALVTGRQTRIRGVRQGRQAGT